MRRRSARVWAPRYVGGAIVLRGVLQPLTELRTRYSRQLPRALELADPEQGALQAQHSALGVAVEAAPAPEPAARVVEPAQRS